MNDRDNLLNRIEDVIKSSLDDILQECVPEYRNVNVVREDPTQTLIDQRYNGGWNGCNDQWIKNLKSKGLYRSDNSISTRKTFLNDEWHKESPPDETSLYLVQYEGGTYGIAKWSNESYYGSSPIKHEYRWTHKAQYATVYAWRPLPEPCEEIADD